jgi:hypothetical protein
MADPTVACSVRHAMARTFIIGFPSWLLGPHAGGNKSPAEVAGQSRNTTVAPSRGLAYFSKAVPVYSREIMLMSTA